MKLLPGDAVKFSRQFEVTPGGIVSLPALTQNEGIFMGYGAMLLDPDLRVAVVMPFGLPEDTYQDPVSVPTDAMTPLMGSPPMFVLARSAKRLADDGETYEQAAIHLNTFADLLGLWLGVPRQQIWDEAVRRSKENI